MNDTSAVVTATADEPKPAELPIFYRRPQVLDATLHAKAGLGQRQNFRFASETNAIMLTGTEFGRAALDFPLVFAAAAPALPFAIVGLRERENLFVNAEGEWRDDAYVPAYVRRYPFIFVADPAADRLVLCVDEAADNFEAESAQPFFVDGAPAPAVRDVLRFCESFQAQYEDTLQFGEWLEQNQLLESRVARAELADGSVFTLSGFRMVDADRMRALTNEQVLHLHTRGWLPLLHFHLQSLANWPRLTRLMPAGTAPSV